MTSKLSYATGARFEYGWTTTIWCPQARNPRASSYVLQPLPPEKGGNASVAMRMRIVCGPQRAIEHAAVAVPAELIDDAQAGSGAEPATQSGIGQPLQGRSQRKPDKCG